MLKYGQPHPRRARRVPDGDPRPGADVPPSVRDPPPPGRAARRVSSSKSRALDPFVQSFTRRRVLGGTAPGTMSAPTFVPSPAAVAGPAERPPERPTGAFVSAMIGGIAVLIFAVLEIDLGASCQLSGSCVFTTFGGTPEVYVASGILGVVVGAMAVVFALLAYIHPEHRVLAGVMLIVLAILSLISFWGGFAVGFLGTLIGGILAIAWQPGPQYLGYQPVFPAAYGYPAAPAPPYYAPPPPAPPPILRVCLKCGRAVDLQAKFCAHCGAALP